LGIEGLVVVVHIYSYIQQYKAENEKEKEKRDETRDGMPCDQFLMSDLCSL
jgi:hypothetical protein